jgi:hypothetical protein
MERAMPAPLVAQLYPRIAEYGPHPLFLREPTHVAHSDKNCGE